MKSSAMKVYKRHITGSLFTHAQGSQADGIITAVTTQELLWFDQRYMEKPLMAVKHAREFDKTLEARTYVISQGQSPGFEAYLTSS